MAYAARRTLNTTGRISMFLVLAATAFVSLALAGCDEKASSDVATVSIKGQKYNLEIAATDDKRFLGLGKRKQIDADGGMIFVFPDAQVREFVMRDCEADIDIIYLDGAGRILAMHEMKMEPLRGPGEEADANGFNATYDARLKKYSSRFPSQLVVELRGGEIARLKKDHGLTEADKVVLDAEGLKKLAR